MIEILSRSGQKVGKYRTRNTEEIVGVNDRFELARAIDVLRLRKIKSLTEKGVTVYDPGTTWIDMDVKVGRDTVIYPSVILEGESVIGSHCTLYPYVHLIDTRVGKRVKLLSSSMIEQSVIHDDARVGPFTHLRPKTIIRQGAKVGNFVEMKNTDFGRGSKAGHLTYLGDADIQGDVNIGAGTITCNYDGARKSKTKIEAGAFIGSGTELIAPVKIGKKAYVGAGSTITKNVSPEALAVSRSRQEEKRGWAKKKRKK
jgi:bifunctional UDP-N-acetylglucosamine pyrophosphorylase/glucosamine-1-phosphate N-acetyltransferase